MKESQTNRILEALLKGDPISPMNALRRFGCFRLSARIQNLRDAGHKISTNMVRIGGKTVGVYSMEGI